MAAAPLPSPPGLAADIDHPARIPAAVGARTPSAPGSPAGASSAMASSTRRRGRSVRPDGVGFGAQLALRQHAPSRRGGHGEDRRRRWRCARRRGCWPAPPATAAQLVAEQGHRQDAAVPMPAPADRPNAGPRPAASGRLRSTPSKPPLGELGGRGRADSPGDDPCRHPADEGTASATAPALGPRFADARRRSTTPGGHALPQAMGPRASATAPGSHVHRCAAGRRSRADPDGRPGSEN